MNSATALIKRTLSVSVLMSVGMSIAGSYLCGKKEMREEAGDKRQNLVQLANTQMNGTWNYIPLHKPRQDFRH